MPIRPGAPPFLLLHGADVQFIPCAQSKRLRDALVAAGVDVALELFEGANHMWLGSPAAAQQALDRTVDELRRAPRAP